MWFWQVICTWRYVRTYICIYIRLEECLTLLASGIDPTCRDALSRRTRPACWVICRSIVLNWVWQVGSLPLANNVKHSSSVYMHVYTSTCTLVSNRLCGSNVVDDSLVEQMLHRSKQHLWSHRSKPPLGSPVPITLFSFLLSLTSWQYTLPLNVQAIWKWERWIIQRESKLPLEESTFCSWDAVFRHLLPSETLSLPPLLAWQSSSDQIQTAVLRCCISYSVE